MKKLIFLTSCLLGSSNLQAQNLPLPSAEFTAVQKEVEDYNKKYGNGSFEKAYSHCKGLSASVESSFGLDGNPSMGIDGSLSALECAKIFEIGDKYTSLRSRIWV